MQSPEAGQTHDAPRARTGALVTVGRADAVPEGRAATVTLADGAELALFNVGGTFYALANSCPHRGAPLAEGNLCGHAVECDWHGWRFDLKTGACLSRASEPAETYEVIVEDGWIKIKV